MRYSVNNYVEAFAEVVKEVPQDKAVNGLLRLLVRTGDIKHSGKILESIHKKLVIEKGGKWVNVEVAREQMPKKGLLKSKFSGKDYIDYKINPELVAGMRITINGEEEVDNSLHNKLKKLFNNN